MTMPCEVNLNLCGLRPANSYSDSASANRSTSGPRSLRDDLLPCFASSELKL